MISAAALLGLLCIAGVVMFAAHLMRQLGAGDIAQVILGVLAAASIAALAGAVFA